MKSIVSILFLLSLVFSPASFSKDLILSANLVMDYPDPKLISHTQSSLIFKYDDWSFFHEIVNPKNIYQSIDLTGVEQAFLRSIFNQEKRKALPKWLAVLSQEQADEFGIETDNIDRKFVGQSELISVYDAKRESAQLYIFEELVTHHISVYGSKEKLDLIKHSIKGR